MIIYHNEYDASKGSFSLKNKRQLSQWIKEILTSSNYKVGDINFIFADDDYILDINNQYLGHNYYTDVITFDTSEYDEVKLVNKVSGDIFISVDTVSSNAKEYGTDFLDELHRVIIHGILHLSGHDDITDDEKIEMREAENSALNILKEKYAL